MQIYKHVNIYTSYWPYIVNIPRGCKNIAELASLFGQHFSPGESFTIGIITDRSHQIWIQILLSKTLGLYSHVLPQDLVKSLSREIRVWTFPIALKFNSHIGSSAAEMPAKFQSDTIIITPNLAASRLHEIWR